MQNQDQDEYVWYFAYAGAMDLAVLMRQIGEPAPLESYTVVADNAWLSFDYRGIPFVDPAYPSLIIKDYNDHVVTETSKDKLASLVFRRYLHERCYPGIPFSDPGEIPPAVEGVAYMIERKQLGRLALAPGFKLTSIQCQRFEHGDAEKRSESPFPAMTLIAKDRHRAGSLMPSVKSYASVYRNALIQCLSTRYLRYLVHLRPYNTDHAGKSVQRLRKVFIALVLSPLFLSCYFPVVVLQKLFPSYRFHDRFEAAKGRAGDLVRLAAILIERIAVRPIFGDVAYSLQTE